MNLKGKRILLGVTGSIAAYKSALLTRLLIKSGAEVQIIMSASALDFITPLTLATLSKNPVLTEFSNQKTGEWINHVELGLWPDLFIVAPASANTIGKFANGLCDNLLSATYLSSRCPVMIAPAMDLDMYQHPSVLSNLKKLTSYGNIILEAESGELASGLSGQGRLMEPEHILLEVEKFFKKTHDFSGKKVLVTLGPTQEAIDPVRFISNHSSGKMGFAIAKAFQKRGADVYVVAGPVSIFLKDQGFHLNQVSSAKEMYETSKGLHSHMDICVFAAAVADYAPENVAKEKIKKEDSELSLRMVKNVDIALELGKLKKANQIHVGFALETENEESNAKAKLEKKNFDLVVLNSAKEEGAGFKLDTNRVKIFHRKGMMTQSELLPKSEIAELILEEVKKVPVWV